MKYTRKSFLKLSGALAIGAVPFLKACAPSTRSASPFGIQLYTLRDIIGDDPEGTIRTLADYGYKQIESYEGPMGIFWNMGHNNFKSFLDDVGISMVSTHANVFQNYEQKVEQLAEIGVPYITCPYIGDQGSIDAYKEMAETFNNLGEIANNAGIKFAYHNHAYTFEEMDGQIPQQILMDETDPDLVEYQMDIYWVEAAGQDSIDWINRYPGRFTSCHIKDLGRTDGGHESVVVGTGTIDFPAIVDVAKDNGMEYYLVEQEAYTGTTPMQSAESNARYMENLDL